MEPAGTLQQDMATERVMAWRPAITVFTVLALAFIGLYWTTAVALVRLWAKTGMFQYCFLIFPISAWLIWGKRHELAARHVPTVCPWALVLLAGTAFVWFLGRIASVDVVEQAAFVATFPVLVLVVFGTAIFRALLFPMIYLVFAIPAGYSAVAPLQRITAHISVHVLQWTGVPVLLQGGHYIITPSATWSVARACSGIRFFTACTAIGSLFAYLFFTSYWRRAIFIVASMIVPIIANGLRVYFTILIGENFGLQYAQGTDHMIFGWQFFGTVLFLLLLVGWFLREPPHEDSQPEPTVERGPGWKNVIPIAVLAAVILGAAPAWAGLIRTSVSPKSAPTPLVVDGAGGWSRHADLSSAAWKPQFKGADYRIDGRYSRAGDEVALFAALYDGAQVDGHDLLAYGNAVFDAGEWQKTGTAQRTIALASGRKLAVRTVVLRQGPSYRLVWYWYQVNGRDLTSQKRVKAWQAWHQLAGGLHSSVFAISSGYSRDGRKTAVNAMKNFLQTAYPKIQRKFAAARRPG
jgi:exosortase A